MHNILNAILNTILVSIPEEIVVVSLTLIFLKRFDLLDWRRWKRNIKYMIIMTSPAALATNVFRYILIIPKPLVTLLGTLLLIIMIFVIHKKTLHTKDSSAFAKVIFSNIISIIIIMTIESLYFPFILFILKKPIEYLIANIFYTFLLIFPVRLLEFMLLVSIIIKQNRILHIKLFNYIFTNKAIFRIILPIMLMFMVFMSYMIKLIAVDKILNELNITQQLITTIFVLTIPVFLIFSIGWLINYFFSQLTTLSKSHQNMFDDDYIE